VTIERMFAEILLLSLGTSGLFFLLRPVMRRLSVRPASRMAVWWLLTVRLLLPVPIRLPGLRDRVSIPDLPLPGLASSPVESHPVASQTAMDAALNLTASPTLSLLEVLGLIWIAGVTLTLIYLASAYIFQRRRLLRHSIPASESVATILAELCEELHLHRMLPVRVSAAAPMPLLIGFLRPCILLPHEDDSPMVLRLILRHELTHFRRRDLWIKLALLLSRALHWFNPVLFLLSREIADDMELACDAAVLQGRDADYARAYSHAILSAIQPVSARLSGLTTGFHGGANTMKKRLTAIRTDSPMRRGRMMVALAAALLLLVGVLAGCVGDAFPTEQNGLYDFGSISDLFRVRGQDVRVRYFPESMTIDDFLTNFDLTAEEANPQHGTDFPIQSYRVMDAILFDETGDLPWHLSVNTLEDGRLRNLSLTGSFWGVPYEDAMAQAEIILAKIEDACGKGITYEEWMESGGDNRMVIHPYGDPFDSLEELGTFYTCEYLFLKTGDFVDVSVSHRAVEYDTTERLGVAYDSLFEVTIGVVINRE